MIKILYNRYSRCRNTRKRCNAGVPLNKAELVNIATPVGKTGNIHLKDKVKQGTIYSLKLCCAATDKVNVTDKTSAA